MPRTTFSRELEVPAPAADCWRTLTDVPRLVDWVSIVEGAKELEPLSRYTAVLMDRVGPFRLRADLDVTVSEVRPPSRIRVSAAGEDRQVASRLSVDALLTLADRGAAGTLLAVTGVYEVTGRVAALGSGTINKKAERVLDDFFATAARELGGGP